MTSNWNNFNLPSQESLIPGEHEHANLPATTNLNLADLATNPLSQGGGGGGSQQKSDGSVTGVVGSFFSGIGKGALGTYQSIFGQSDQQIMANIKAGGSGVTSSQGAMPIVGKFTSGLSNTVKLAYQHPDVLLSLPGQVMHDFTSGNASQKANMLGQLAFFVGSMAVGGSGASKAAQLAGDVREAGVVADGASALSTASTGVKGLESATKLDGLIQTSSVSALTDASSAARADSLFSSVSGLSKVNEATTATRVDGLLQSGSRIDGISSASRVDGLLNTGESVSTRLPGSLGSEGWAGRVLPSSEGGILTRPASTDFLGPDVAKTLDVGTVKPPLSERFFQGFKGIGSAGEQGSSSLLSRILGKGSVAEGDQVGSLATRIPRGLDFTPPPGEVNLAGKLTTETNLAGDAGRTGTTLDALNAGRTGTATDLLNAGRTSAAVDPLAEVAPRITAGENLTVNSGRLTTSLQELSRSGETLSREAGALRESLAASGAKVPDSLARFEQAAGDLTSATSEAERLKALENLRTASGTLTSDLSQQAPHLTSMVEGMTGKVEALAPQVETVNRLSQMGTAFETLSTKTDLVASETQRLKSLAGIGDQSGATLGLTQSELPQSFSNLERATSAFRTATSESERLSALTDMQNAALKVSDQLPEAVSGSRLSGAVDGLSGQVQAVSRMQRLEQASTAVVDQGNVVARELGAVKALPVTGTNAEVSATVGKLEQAAADFRSASSEANQTAALGRMREAAAGLKDVPGAENLTRAVNELGTQFETAGRLQRLSQATAAVTEQAASVVSESSLLDSKLAAMTTTDTGAARQAIARLNQAAGRFETVSGQAEQASALTEMRDAASVLARQFPEESASLMRSVDQLTTQAQTASRLARLDQSATVMSEGTDALAQTTAGIQSKIALAEPTAVTAKTTEAASTLEQSTLEFRNATSQADRVTALNKMRAAASELGPQFEQESASLTRTIDRLSTETQTMGRLERLDAATTTLSGNADLVLKETAGLKSTLPSLSESVATTDSAAAAQGSVAKLEQSAADFKAAVTEADRTQALSQMKTAAADLAERFPAQSERLTQAVDKLSENAQTVSRLERLDQATTSVTSQASTVTRELATLKANAVAESATGAVPESVTRLEQSTELFQAAATDWQRAAALKDMQTAAASVAADVRGAEQVTGAVDRLASETSNLSRLERLDQATTAVTSETANVAKETEALKSAVTATRSGAAASETAAAPESITKLEQSTERFQAAVTDSQKAAALKDMQTAAADVAREFPAQAEGVTGAVERLSAQTETASRLARLNEASISLSEQASMVASKTADFKQLVTSGDALAAEAAPTTEVPAAVTTLERSTADFQSAATEAQRTQALSEMRAAAREIASTYPQEETQAVVRAVDSLSAQTENLSRLERLDTATSAVAEHSNTLSRVAADLSQTVSTANGTVPGELTNIEQAANKLSQTTTLSERSAQLSTINENLTAVEAQLAPGETTALRASFNQVQAEAATAERLSLTDSAFTSVADRAGTAQEQVAAIKVARGAEDAEVQSALSNLDQSSALVKSTAGTVPLEQAERFAQMDRDLATVEGKLGLAKTADLRNSIAAMQADAGTAERLAAVDQSYVRLSSSSDAVVSETAALRGSTVGDSGPVSDALTKIENTVVEARATGAIPDTASLAPQFETVQRALGPQSTVALEAAVGQYTSAATAARAATSELIDYQGVKLTQGIDQLEQGGRLANATQIDRIATARNDLAIIKAFVPSDSASSMAVANLEQHLAGVDAVSNILTHPEVARASVKDLLKLAQSNDSQVAQAAADRLVLSGKISSAADSPVIGLLSDRAAFWSRQNDLARLEGVRQARLFESGRVAGLAWNDPVLLKLAKDAAMAGGGTTLLLGNAGYELTRVNIMAQDIIRNQQLQRDAEAKKQAADAAAGSGSDAAVKANGQGEQAALQGQSPTPAGQASAGDAGGSQAANPLASGGGGGGVEAAGAVSNQAVFRSNAQENTLGPAIVAYALPQYLAAERLAPNLFPIYGGDTWSRLARQYGGNPWGWTRAPGVDSRAGVSEPAPVLPARRALAFGQTTPQELTKIAQARFPVPRVLSLTDQTTLLNSTGMISGMARPQAVGMGSGGASARSWQTTVDWSQVHTGGSRSGRSEGRGHDLRHLGPLEDGEEQQLDAPGNGSSAGVDPDQGSGPSMLASQVGPSGMSVQSAPAARSVPDPSQALLAAANQDEQA